MAETEHLTQGLVGRLLVGLALLAVTALWMAALWLALYRPDLLAAYGRAAQFAVIAVVWVLPFLLTIVAWLSLHRARKALAEARALRDETDAMARRLQAARQAAARVESAAKKPPPAPEKPKTASPETPSPKKAGGGAKPRSKAEEKAADDISAKTAGAHQAASHPDRWAALDFPRSEADTEGFEALRRALGEDPKLAAVIRTAQHVLSLLGQENVHLDAGGTEPSVPPDVLRQYAAGARGPAVAALGEVDDRESLALAVGRLRRDPAFRSAAHRFVAAFDAWLASVVSDADDRALARIAASRSGRAFRLLGRATGNFG